MLFREKKLNATKVKRARESNVSECRAEKEDDKDCHILHILISQDP